MKTDYKKILVDWINRDAKDYQLTESGYGFFSVDPMPSDRFLKEFYQQKYFEDLSAVASKGMDTGLKDTLERFHHDRQYDEIISCIQKQCPKKNPSILDVGCGTGKLLTHLKAKGFTRLLGTEFKDQINIKGIKVFTGSFTDFKPGTTFDVIIMNNVLEHVIRPEQFMQKAWDLLEPGGLIRVQVPNDLSFAQYRIIKKMNPRKFYFFQPPEHLHYFDFSSLGNLFGAFGLEVCQKMTVFPMEMFLAMGMDYADLPEAGRQCHQHRIQFEHAMGQSFLNAYYEKLADLSFGRVAILYGKKQARESGKSHLGEKP